MSTTNPRPPGARELTAPSQCTTARAHPCDVLAHLRECGLCRKPIRRGDPIYYTPDPMPKQGGSYDQVIHVTCGGAGRQPAAVDQDQVDFLELLDSI